MSVQVAGIARHEYGIALITDGDVDEAKDLVTRSIREYEQDHDLTQAEIQWQVTEVDDLIEVEILEEE